MGRQKDILVKSETTAGKMRYLDRFIFYLFTFWLRLQPYLFNQLNPVFLSSLLTLPLGCTALFELIRCAVYLRVSTMYSH